MTKTIFLNTFLAVISVLLLSTVLFFAIRYKQTQDETYEALRQEAEYAEKGLAASGISYLKSLNDLNRITLIEADGEVVYDSVFSHPLTNQSDYPEVQEALSQGTGESIRNSRDSGEQTMYFAMLCSDGRILRLSRPMSAVRKAFESISPALWILVIAVIIAGALSFRSARQIVRPINNINLENPDISKYPELSPLIEKVQEQKMTIQEEAANREQMRREFTANVSHELKTPLTSISGFAELMASGTVSDDKIKEFSSDIHKESRRLMALIDDILQLSQLDEESVEHTDEKVDLYELSIDVMESLKNVADSASVSLSLTGDHAEVSGVYRLLHEMVYNLCDNAIKYNHPHGSVEISVNESDDKVMLTVADTGIGISPEHQKRVFERFYRVDKSHSKEIGGTGLGLSIVKHAAQFHGAEVEMESEVDKGTKITLIFNDVGAKSRVSLNEDFRPRL